MPSPLPDPRRPHMAVRAIVFDMDGVLIDSEVIWQQVRADYAVSLGHVWTHDDQMAMLGCSTPVWSEAMRQRLGLLHLSAREVADHIKQRVQAAFEHSLPTRPGAAEALQALSHRYPLALASGSPRNLVECAMRLTGFGHYFQSIWTGDDVQHGKPHPEIYLRAVSALGIAPGEALGIEDAPNGLRALRAAGMRAVAAPCPEFPLDTATLALADRVVASLHALTPELVQTL